ncbi:prorelaxin H2-like [Perognathus longimembris pacificus]|uniref:prorelaxin H2-like n=1 Tax=Perognathus longimembris pacificus TaxID=214514 RepID=UPI002019354F|nr:prorelaxin H2-like [Perognathus longimembris pacificus]
MSHLFLIHLLGLGLLLSQPSRAWILDMWLDEEIKVCGREFARTVIDICGRTSHRRMALSQEEPHLESGPSTEPMPYYINKDTDLLNMMLEFIPNLPQEPEAMLTEKPPLLLELQQQYAPTLKDSNLSFEEFKKIIRNIQSEAEDKSLSELKYFGLDNHSRKKRQTEMLLSKKCCQDGCTRRLITKFC